MTSNDAEVLFLACGDLFPKWADMRTASAWTRDATGHRVSSWSLTGWGNNQLMTVVQVIDGRRREYRVKLPGGYLVVGALGPAEWWPYEGEDRYATAAQVWDAVELVTNLVPFPQVDSMWVYADADRNVAALVWLPQYTKVPEFRVMVRADTPQAMLVANELASLTPDKFMLLVNTDRLFAASHVIVNACLAYSGSLWRIDGQDVDPPATVVGSGFNILVTRSSDLREVIVFVQGSLFLNAADIRKYHGRADQISQRYHTARVLEMVGNRQATAWADPLQQVLYYVPGPDGGDPPMPPIAAD